MPERYWLETLGCPKNQVDSDKLAGTLERDGYVVAATPAEADLVVVNTCAFIEAAREESIGTILTLADERREGARLVVTGCMAERYGDELAASLPEVDLVAPFGVPVSLGRKAGVGPHAGPVAPAGPVAFGGALPGGPIPLRSARSPETQPVPTLDLLNLPRPPVDAPWAYVKVAEGCDRRCGFCAIPSFRGKQRSRPLRAVLAEIAQLASGRVPLREVVLVAQDLASYGLDRSGASRVDRAVLSADDGFGTLREGPKTGSNRPIVDLVHAVGSMVDRVRLLYLYPSSLDHALIDAVLGTGVAYFDLSLQHVSRPLLQRMRRWGDGERFLERIADIRRDEPAAAFRSSFIVGYPGETEEDHDALLAWLAEARLDWVGFFPYSREDGTHAAGLDDQVPPALVAERLAECVEIQDPITAARRDASIGEVIEVLVDAPGEGRSYREAPEIDGIVSVPLDLPVGTVVPVVVTGADGPDLVAQPVPGSGEGPDHRGADGNRWAAVR
ncbi:MAG: MiaB/RimO family radical SAM methylthiotransferase [Acidimicrobiales bacterium]